MAIDSRQIWQIEGTLASPEYAQPKQHKYDVGVDSITGRDRTRLIFKDSLTGEHPFLCEEEIEDKIRETLSVSGAIFILVETAQQFKEAMELDEVSTIFCKGVEISDNTFSLNVTASKTIYLDGENGIFFSSALLNYDNFLNFPTSGATKDIEIKFFGRWKYATTSGATDLSFSLNGGYGATYVDFNDGFIFSVDFGDCHHAIINNSNEDAGSFAVLDKTLFRTCQYRNNVSFGFSNHSKITIGFNNSSFGFYAGQSLIAGDNNSFFGHTCGVLIDNGVDNTGAGYHCLFGAIGSEISYNTSMGSYSSTNYIDICKYNVSIGYYSQNQLKSSNYNTSLGALSMVGVNAINDFALRCISIGYQSMNLVRQATDCIAIGYRAQYSGLFGASNCISLGYESGYSMASSTKCITIGYKAGYNLIGGENNILIGNEVNATTLTSSNELNIGGAITGGVGTTKSLNSVGSFSVATNKFTVNDITGECYSAKRFYTGTQNTLFGHQTGNNITSGADNIYIGYQSGLNNQTGSQNISIGYQSQRVANNSNWNVSIGMYSQEVNTGYDNTSIGKNTLASNTSGYRNTALGANALYLTNFIGTTGVGYYAEVTANYQVQLGNSTTTTYAYGAVQNRSDQRDKADIQPILLGLDFLTKIEAVSYKWNYREDYKEVIETEVDGKKQIEVVQLENDGSKKRSRFHNGVIAQQVKEVMDEMGVDFAGYQDHSINGGQDVLSIGYQEFIPILIKSVQELKNTIFTLEQRIKTLEGV